MWWSFLAAASPWRTVETENFRVHYPEPAQAFAQETARHLENGLPAVLEVVGTEKPKVIDVYIRDPAGAPNGMAIAYRRRPTIELWVTPPTADFVIGQHRSWAELVSLHEYAHIVHLRTPPRRSDFPWLLGIGPVSVPDWMAEGYATYIEGQVTGFGRPTDPYRAAYLRVLAVEGRFPSYRRLKSAGWIDGGSHYLIGSAFVEWLVARSDVEAPSRLWRRMTAATPREFDEAFEGVFGGRPEVLYGRFVAEMTARAMAAEGTGPEQVPFLERLGETGPPAVSPDGERIAFMAAVKDSWRLQVLSTEVDEEALAREAERLEREGEDPLDVPVASRTEPHALLLDKEISIADPRWLPDQRLIYSRARQFGDRRIRDLGVIDLDGHARWVTRGEGVRAPDPDPTGTFAVAVKLDWGRTALARVDLSTGDTELLQPLSLDVLDSPRVSPDGSRVAFLRQTYGAPFRPYVMDLDTGETRSIDVPPDARFYDLEWHGEDALVFGAGSEGAMEIVRVDLSTDTWSTLTETGGVAMVPTLAGDVLYHLQLHAEGKDIIRTELGGNLPPSTPAPFPPAPVDPIDVAPPLEPLGERPYGLGRPLAFPLVGGAFGSTIAAPEIGLRFGDYLGRHDGFIMAGRQGVGLHFTARGHVLNTTLHAASGLGVGDLEHLALGRFSMQRRRHSWSMGMETTVSGHVGDELSGRMGLEMWVAAHGELMGLDLRARTWRKGAEGAREAYARLRVGKGNTWLVGSGRTGRSDSPWALGAPPTSVLDRTLQWDRVGGFGWQRTSGVVGGLLEGSASLEVHGVGPFIQTVRAGEQLWGTRVGVRGHLEARMRERRLPMARVVGGVACVTSDPSRAPSRSGCLDVRNYAGWASLVFEP